MKKTLVLVVDRDDDFGVKGKVNTPVVGVQNCLDAAAAFGIADPEDSDLNALYSAISACLELLEDGQDADVALICGDEKVGHRSDLALVAQLEEVLDLIHPDSIVLVGDGAEDEYIYPIISSRAHVDSVRKVYVKQAPGLEGTFYIITRMMKDPDKRKRFLAPLGFILLMLSLVFLIPSAVVMFVDHSIDQITSMPGPVALMFIGLILLLYGYNVAESFYNLRKTVMSSLVGRTTSIIFICLAIAVVAIMAIYSVMEINDLYLKNIFAKIVYFVDTMVWPIVIAVVLYQIGTTIEGFMRDRSINLSTIFGCLGLASLGLVATGILDAVLNYMDVGYGIQVSILEIVCGVALSIIVGFLKSKFQIEDEARAEDEAF